MEALERTFVQAPEVSWALREVMRVGGEADAALARRVGLHYTDALALDHLMQSPEGLGPAELANRLGIRPASVTELVDRLTASGHVTRRPHASDRRRLVVEATPKARADILVALAPLLEALNELADRLDPATAAAITDYLRDVAAELRAYAVGRRG